MTMKVKLLLTIGLLLFGTGTFAQTRHWGTQDGLPTGEVRQIVPLPNRQMLVNCEGIFCISNGSDFTPVPCDRRKAYLLEHYADSVGYGYQWQDDSLLWLRDFYRIYLFDMRTRSFRYDIEGRLTSLGEFTPSSDTVSDWQGGLWTGTRNNGIVYAPPARKVAITVDSSDSLVAFARKTEKLDLEIDPERRLQCRGLNQLGYFFPGRGEFVSLNERLPRLNGYRHIVGVCALDSLWVVLYTQNGACLLNMKADTLADFIPAEIIGEYTDKYNCMVRGRDGTLWAGTQNGLFQVKREEIFVNGDIKRVLGLANNCIRSLVEDAEGNLWAGTSCGISRITPTVVNYGEDDSIPAVSMMERAACLTDDGRLVFVHHGLAATVFHPEWLSDEAGPSVPVLTQVQVNGNDGTGLQGKELTLPYDENYLTFQFSALDYAHPSHVRYRYRMSGLEDGWHTDNGTIGLAKADYKALSPGNYVFEAQASSSDGVWSESLTVSVTILPPWWLTWWAKFVYCVLGLMAIMALMGYYLKRKRAALVRENDDRVNRLFEMREEARHQFADNTSVDPSKIGVNPEEEALVTKLLSSIEAHMADEDYGVDQLASDVALSRTNLYGRLRNMLGISPADFIRNVRLKRAARMLAEEPSLSIAEISERVGFGTARNFSTQFKKMFGVLPSEYKGHGENIQCL